jgi:hypothetical protein
VTGCCPGPSLENPFQAGRTPLGPMTTLLGPTPTPGYPRTPVWIVVAPPQGCVPPQNHTTTPLLYRLVWHHWVVFPRSYHLSPLSPLGLRVRMGLSPVLDCRFPGATSLPSSPHRGKGQGRDCNPPLGTPLSFPTAPRPSHLLPRQYCFHPPGHWRGSPGYLCPH